MNQEVKIINGYYLKDEVARNNVEEVKKLVDKKSSSLICNIEYRDSNEYLEGITTGNIKGFIQGFTTTPTSYILAIREGTDINTDTNMVYLEEISKSTGETLKTVFLELGHANSIAYNQKDSEVYVAIHSHKENGETIPTNDIAIIDYDTFTIKSVVTPPNSIERVSSISYDNKNNVLAIGTPFNIYIMENLYTINSNIVIDNSDIPENPNPSNSGGSAQNFVLFDNYIYVTRYNANGINVFDLNGDLVENYYNFDIDAPFLIQELESIAVEDEGTLYLASTQTCNSDQYKYKMYDRTILKTNLKYNGYKYYDYINNTTSSVQFYVDSDTTNTVQIGTSTLPFKNIQQAIMAAQSIKKILSCIINLIGSEKQYGYIVAKGTPHISINGNNNLIYGIQLNKQNIKINELNFVLDTLINVTGSDVYPSNIKILNCDNVKFESCEFNNGDEEKKDYGVYLEDSKVKFISCSFNNLVNCMLLYNSDVYISSGITVTECTYYFYPRGLCNVHQNSNAVMNRSNPNASIVPFISTCNQYVSNTFDSSTKTLTFSNSNVESSSSAINMFIIDGVLSIESNTYSFVSLLYRTQHLTFTFIKSDKSAKYDVDLKPTHTTNSGVWTFDLRVLKTDVSSGAITDISDSCSMDISNVKTSK